MKLFAKLFDRLRRNRTAPPIPEAIRRIAALGYTEAASLERLKADHTDCRNLRQFVRENFSEQEYLHYLRVLDDLESLITAKQKLAQCVITQQSALTQLDAAYDKQQKSFVN